MCISKMSNIKTNPNRSLSAEEWAREPRVLAVVGLGPVGEAVLRAALADSRFVVRACVEPQDEGRRRAETCGFQGALLSNVSELRDLASGTAIVCTSSRFSDIAPVAESLVRRGYDVVSTCEEFIFPGNANEEGVTHLTRVAVESERCVIGAGVNPGFVMDVLPAVMTMATRNIEQIRILRRVDVRKRRQRLLEKVGVGLEVPDFERLNVAHQIGHVGLSRSLLFVADILGWGGEVHEEVTPMVMSDSHVVKGVRHVAEVRDALGVVRIEAVLEMFMDAVDVDRIEIDGTPPCVVEIPRGLSGDEATVSAVLNMAAATNGLPSGFLTMADVLPPVWRASLISPRRSGTARA